MMEEAYQAARGFGMSIPTVWSMIYAIRKAIVTHQMELLKRIVEMGKLMLAEDDVRTIKHEVSKKYFQNYL